MYMYVCVYVYAHAHFCIGAYTKAYDLLKLKGNTNSEYILEQ